MAEKENPGALAGATGAEKPYHATAAGFPEIAYWRPIGQIVAALASQSARHWRKADD